MRVGDISRCRRFAVAGRHVEHVPVHDHPSADSIASAASYQLEQLPSMLHVEEQPVFWFLSSRTRTTSLSAALLVPLIFENRLNSISYTLE